MLFWITVVGLNSCVQKYRDAAADEMNDLWTSEEDMEAWAPEHKARGALASLEN